MADYYNEERQLKTELPFASSTCDAKRYRDEGCINFIMSFRSDIKNIRDDNQTLLERYRAIKSYPFIHTYYEGEHSEFPPISELRELSFLEMSDAIMLIDDGDIEEGLNRLNEEIVFHKRLLRSQDIGTFSYLGMFLLMRDYYYIAELIDQPKMKDHLDSPIFLSLLNELPKEAFTAIRDAYLATAKEYLFIPLYGLTAENIWANMDDERFPLSYLFEDREPDLKWEYKSYDPAKTINAAYQLLLNNPYYQKEPSTQPERGERYRQWMTKQKAKYDKGEAPVSFSDLIPPFSERMALAEPDNYLGEAMISMFRIESGEFNHRPLILQYSQLYELTTMLDLINLKLAIKEANLMRDEVAPFLKALGDKAINPYTLKPYEWNAQELTISTPWLSDVANYPKERKKELAGGHQTVFIQFNEHQE